MPAGDQSLELLGDLYARLGQQWVDYGCFAHYVVAPILNPELIQSWFALGFGIQQVHGLYALSHLPPDDPGAPDGIEISLATPEDREALSAFSDVIWRQHLQAPCWAVQLPEIVGATRKGWAEMVDDPEVELWLARQGDQILEERA